MTRTTRKKTFSIVALALAGLVVALRGHQAAPPVVLDVAVETEDGRPVTGLTQADFRVLASGAEQPIELFAAGTERPLSLVLLFDVSSSMDSVLERSVLRKAVERHVVERLQPSDRVHVGSFARTIAIGPGIAGDARALGAAVRKALDPRREETLGPSPIWDAVDAAVTVLNGAPGRRGVLLITDGRATGNRLSTEEAGRRAVAAAVTISVIGEDRELVLRQDESTGVRIRPGAALEWLAKVTGGLYQREAAYPAAPGPPLERAIAELRARYTLGFTPAVRDGKAHDVSIRLNRPNIKLRFRQALIGNAE
jgi:VWFA-related protein